MVAIATWGVPAWGGQVLHMYTALDTAESQLYIPEFEKDTGIKVQWVRLSSGEVLARLRAEAKNPQVSIWYGGPS
jgi:iron(III) transport system substrate-binding protein